MVTVTVFWPHLVTLGYIFRCSYTTAVAVIFAITLCTFTLKSALSPSLLFSSPVARRYLYIMSAFHEAKNQACCICHANDFSLKV